MTPNDRVERRAAERYPEAAYGSRVRSNDLLGAHYRSKIYSTR